jgi:hypothetical protein
LPAWQLDTDGLLVLSVWFQLHLQESGQVSELLIAVKRQPFAHDVSVDDVTHRNTRNRGARLQAFLDDLGFEGLWIGGSLAHGDPLVGLKMVSTQWVDTIALSDGVRKAYLPDAYQPVPYWKL